MFNARIDQAIDSRSNWNHGDIVNLEVETVLHREASCGVAIHLILPQETGIVLSTYYYHSGGIHSIRGHKSGQY
jgi:hypothetical protein